ncbi:hypothetical protein TNCV_534831 [Trichonephila clavipes]|nr:hypothetical protein TNCV_534831 [Trichonephila clavipes]
MATNKWPEYRGLDYRGLVPLKTRLLDGHMHVKSVASECAPVVVRQPRVGIGLLKKPLQASILPASVLQFLVLKTRISFSRPSIHPRFGLPFLRVPIG